MRSKDFLLLSAPMSDFRIFIPIGTARIKYGSRMGILIRCIPYVSEISPNKKSPHDVEHALEKLAQPI